MYVNQIDKNVYLCTEVMEFGSMLCFLFFFALLFWFESFQCLLFKSLSDHVTEHFDDAP